MSNGEKVCWLWLMGKGVEVNGYTAKRLTPPRFTAVWNWIFERSASGYVRAGKVLNGLRARSKAYRKAGTPLDLCAENALCDLASAMDVDKPQTQGIPPRKQP